MLSYHGRLISIMILYAIALHWTWAFILIFDDAAVHATALSAVYRYIYPVPLLITALVTAPTLAFAGLFLRSPWALPCLIPQQIILMMSAAGAIVAIWNAQFADGVIRPVAFIAADQVYSILAAIGHTMALIIHATNGRKIV